MTWSEMYYTLVHMSGTNKRARRRQVTSVLNAMSACPQGKAQLLKLTDTCSTAHEIWEAFEEPIYLRWWLRKVWEWKVRDGVIAPDHVSRYCQLINVASALVDLWPAKSSFVQAQRQCQALRRVFDVYGQPRIR